MESAEFNCINCGVEIKPTKVENPNNPFDIKWEGGVAVRIRMPKGSKLENDVYGLAICDNCILEKENAGLIKKLE
jgi:hypothetical protein